MSVGSDTPPPALTIRTLAMRRAKIEGLLLDAIAIVRVTDTTSTELLSPDKQRALISVLVRVLHIITEAWTS